ncbi:DUF975 family protein [Vagococcus carniphilus]|uniref:DUF975 family protein n=1 Tax=Vagococcus carniphilus TaxID=218144 RepID=UPI00288F9015|nr:DUF975 family protein [Vagococcus carniphilus]MDT2815145.1 DUF975 family protein [Vagococcus carniphilus]MDT2863799.1 DUF975 family protein [Vagococcus carniphilus]
MYKTSAQLKREAKDSLSGRWKEAVLLNLIPSIMQIIMMFFIGLVIAAMLVFVSFMVTSDMDTSSGTSDFADTVRYQLSDELTDEFDSEDVDFSSPFDGLNVDFSSYGIAPLIDIGIYFITIGISFTFLDVVRRRKEQSMEIKDAFRIFNGNDFVPILLINLLMYIFKVLWSFALVIPAFVKHYSYSQSNFIYKDMAMNQDVKSMGATSFITESRNLMRGHKGRLFWIDLSFIGWYLLGMITGGIAMLWINPYINATKAAFYNDLAKDQFLSTTVDVPIEDEEEWTSF